eukprot:TRINITY_DN16020_c0_g1_i1.p1 TRINITY_DN16020_c0_g1~~TRINITY_DN16020_c0_g1_i1.p1  ORF type:complete len:127 (+),score=17.02 TRINITY_DN16020_c0_g1_i1:3-383(+)
MWTSLYRDGEFVEEMDGVDFYNFNFQHMHEFGPVEVLPGDKLYTHCSFNTEGRTEDTIFSTSTQQEMCMHMMWYYPSIDQMSTCGQYGPDASICGFNVDPIPNPGGTDDRDRAADTFGDAPAQCKA